MSDQREGCTARATRCEMTQIVLPPHTNAHGTAFGGQIAAWIDICAAVSAQRFCRRPVVTASFDELAFLRPVHQGMVVILRSTVNRAWHTSMEIGVRVDAEDPLTGVISHCCTAYLTFVSLDPDGRPQSVPSLELGSDAKAKKRWSEAALRRAARLRLREERKAHHPGD